MVTARFQGDDVHEWLIKPAEEWIAVYASTLAAVSALTTANVGIEHVGDWTCAMIVRDYDTAHKYNTCVDN